MNVIKYRRLQLILSKAYSLYQPVWVGSWDPPGEWYLCKGGVWTFVADSIILVKLFTSYVYLLRLTVTILKRKFVFIQQFWRQDWKRISMRYQSRWLTALTWQKNHLVWQLKVSLADIIMLNINYRHLNSLVKINPPLMYPYRSPRFLLNKPKNLEN